jgi:hypothetical protein
VPEIEVGGLQCGSNRPDLLEPFQERPELQRVEQPADFVVVPLAHPAVLRSHLELEVRDQAGHVLVPGDPLPCLLHASPDPRCELLDVGHHALGAPVLLHELGRGLLPHPGDPGDVVGRIALQGHVVQILLRRQAESLLDRRDVVVDDVRDPPPVEHHLDPRPDELEEVPVRGDHHRLHPLFPGTEGQRGDGVVGLVPVHLDDGDLQRAQHFPDQAQLLAELIGGLRTPGLVLGVLLQPDRWRPSVEGHGDEVRAPLAEELDEHRGEPIDGVRHLTGGGGQRRGQGEIGAI